MLIQAETSECVDEDMTVWMGAHAMGVVYTGKARDCAFFNQAFGASHTRQRVFVHGGEVRVDVTFFGIATALLNASPCFEWKSLPADTAQPHLFRHRFKLEVEPGDILTFSKDPYEMVISYLDGSGPSSTSSGGRK